MKMRQAESDMECGGLPAAAGLPPLPPTANVRHQNDPGQACLARAVPQTDQLGLRSAALQ
ncbi:MAG: hypothetical protein ABSC10_06150 [Candidatus Acidiferrales bacterium]|jgi:hypothetical protein